MKRFCDYNVDGRPIVDWGNDRNGAIFARIETREESMDKAVRSLLTQFRELPEDNGHGMKKSDVIKFAFLGSEDFTPITQEQHDRNMARVKRIGNAVLDALGHPIDDNHTDSQNDALPLHPEKFNKVGFFAMTKEKMEPRIKVFSILFVRAENVLSRKKPGSDDVYALLDLQAIGALDYTVRELKKNIQSDGVHIYFITDVFGDQYTLDDLRAEYANYEFVNDVKKIVMSKETGPSWMDWVGKTLTDNVSMYKDSAFALIYSQRANSILPNGMDNSSVIISEDRLMGLEEANKTVAVIENSNGIDRLVYYNTPEVKSRMRTINSIQSQLQIMSNLLVEMKIESGGLKSRSKEQQNKSATIIGHLSSTYETHLSDAKKNLDAVHAAMDSEYKSITTNQ